MSDFDKLRKDLLLKTKGDIANAITVDHYIIQSLAAIDELTTQLNTLTKRLREWHGYMLPEVDRAIDDNETFVRLVNEKSFKELKDEFVKGQSMGAAPGQEHYGPVQLFAKQIYDLFIFKNSMLAYLEQTLKDRAPNTAALAGTTIAARLISNAGSLKRLASLPSSTIQLFGAEKALFRHLKTGARSPKHGHIFNHQLVQSAKHSDAGRVARSLADKIALCAKLDYFKGEKDMGAQYLKDLQVKFAKEK